MAERREAGHVGSRSNAGFRFAQPIPRLLPSAAIIASQTKRMRRERDRLPTHVPRNVRRGESHSMLWLALEALHAGEVHRPRESRAAPALPGRSQLGAAVERAHPQAKRLRVGACRCGVERRAAFGAEPVHPFIPAFRGLGVEPGGAASQDEGAGQAWHRGAKGGAGKGLAIGAMADSDLVGSISASKLI